MQLRLWWSKVQNYIVLDITDPSCSYGKSNTCNLKLTCLQHSWPGVSVRTELWALVIPCGLTSHLFPDVYPTRLLSPTWHLFTVFIDFTPLEHRGHNSDRTEWLLKDVDRTVSWNVQLISQLFTHWQKNNNAKSWSKIVAKSRSTC